MAAMTSTSPALSSRCRLCELVRLERIDESPSRNRRHAGLPSHAAGALTVRIRRRFAGLSLRLRSSRSATMPLTSGAVNEVSW